MAAAELGQALAARPTIVSLGSDPALLLARSALDRLQAATLDSLETYHRENPLRPAMPREELRRRVFGKARAVVFERVADELAAASRVRLLPDAVGLVGHEVRLNPGEEEARRVLVAAAAAAGLAGIELAALAAQSRKDAALLQRVARVLAEERRLARVGDELLVDQAELETLKQRVRERWPKGARIEVGEFKELVGLSRKHAIPLLEYLDRERVTRRAGASRVVV